MVDSKERASVRGRGPFKVQQTLGKKGEPPLKNQVQALGGLGGGMRFLAQSFLRVNGTLVSTWQIS